MHKIISLIVLTLILTAQSAYAVCPAGRALVSGYYSGVHIYDACSGTFERLLDNTVGRISGAQAIWPRPDGMIYVVSENNGRILRYNSSSLSFVDTFISTGVSFKPTGIAFGPDGDIYVGGFDADAVRRYDGSTGALKSTPVPAGAGGLNGPDNGLTFGPDGKLYIPSYNSHSVLRYDPATGAVSTFIAAGTGGLNRPREILFEAGNATLLVSSEGSGQILRFNAASAALLGTFATVAAPAGMNYTNDGRLLVATNDSQVLSLNASSGAVNGPLFGADSTGGLLGSTYVALLTPRVDVSQVGTQYWFVGVGPVGNKLIDIDVASGTGTQFGALFNPADVTRKRWGKIRIVFDSCETASFSWDSNGTDSARFGSGGYPLQLLLGSAFTDICKSGPFSAVSGGDWMNGTWYGGEPRSGEGLQITVSAGGLAVVAMFTHDPAIY